MFFLVFFKDPETISTIFLREMFIRFRKLVHNRSINRAEKFSPAFLIQLLKYKSELFNSYSNNQII